MCHATGLTPGPGLRRLAQVQSYRSRVLFKAACGAIPEDALLLEVGPHGIMRSPLRQNCAGLPYVAGWPLLTSLARH